LDKKIKVYQFLVLDKITNTHRIIRQKATQVAIQSVGGMLLRHTVEKVDPSHVDHSGYLVRR
jgi:hypothetical protein